MIVTTATALFFAVATRVTHGFVPSQSQVSHCCGRRTAGTGVICGVRSSPCRNLRASADEPDSGPDLFDYFDPLLSPHAYPDGVAPENKPQPDAVADTQPRKAPSSNPFGIDYMSLKEKTEEKDKTESAPETSEAPVSAESTGDKDSPDLFDYFDPLASPHSYPNGIQPTSEPQALEIDDRYNPLQMDSVVLGGASKTGGDSSTNKKLGILLMDHGSRNPASNTRLERLAELYQLTLEDDSSAVNVNCEIVVAAAHMEIAKPSIPDGLQTLLDAGVDEIVCHPYFLSPGRHVQEDIPEIVTQAIEDLSIAIPIVTTDPVGSNADVMIGAIHSLVRDSSQTLRGK